MEFSAGQIAAMLGGEIVGDANRMVNNVAGLETSKEGDLCFLGDEKYLPYLATTKASVVLLTKTLYQLTMDNAQCTIILVENARGAMAQLLQAVAEVLNPKRRGIEQPAFIAEGVQVPEDAYVGAMAYIGKNVRLGKGVQIYPQVYLGDNVVIGDNTILYPGVKVYYNCRVGANCILHAGVVIGGDGFGFEPDAQGVYHKVPQIGIAVIEDDVEIGANTTVDRAMMGETRVKKNTKIDNLVQVAHNVVVGESTVLCAQVGIAGSTTVGNHCMLTGQVGVAGHIEITDNCVFGGQTGVTGSIKKPGMYLGTPAMDANLCRRVYAAMRHLPEMYRKLV
ncbi:MAG: UDP-3-O-(3-hydroxymyristoyl)glucosamine N-acyltransferase [Paludibacteraceae bacterium]|nr:UDP-3-O-(3-hydroxymyristoyl)glucosamine N-acyltransferase [Paludibacteraceae bacterium]